MSTKPSATRAYITPASSPPASTSMKKISSIENLIFEDPSVRHPEVGVDDLLVAAHFIRRAVGELAAVVEHHHAVRDIHHHAHVMLDQHDGGAIVVVDVEDEAAHVLLFLEVHAGHGLVEQQDRRLGGERAAQLDAVLQAGGQPPDRRLADMLDLEEVDDLLDRLAVSELLALRRPHPQRLLQEVAAHLQVAPGHDVVEHRHTLEERDVLESS